MLVHLGRSDLGRDRGFGSLFEQIAVGATPIFFAK